MTTFNGKHENLRFHCNSCGKHEYIEINPESDEDMLKLGKWLLTHSYSGGSYNTFKIKNDCELCGDKITWGTEYVTNEGKVLCHNCAKDISQVFLKRQ